MRNFVVTIRLLLLIILILISVVVAFFVFDGFVWHPNIKGISERDLKDLGQFFYLPVIVTIIISTIYLKLTKKGA